MPPKIWVTQTLPRALDSAKDFEALGLEAIVSPVLDIELTVEGIVPPSDEACLIFTALNGVRAFAQTHKIFENKVICVGDATAELARKFGFTDVTSASGDAADVIDLIKKTVPLSQPLRHCAGRHVRGQVTERLREVGYKADRVQYYASLPVKRTAVDVTAVDYIAIYSPLGAKTLSELLKQEKTDHISTVSISEATDKGLGDLKVRERFIALSSNQMAMLQCLNLDLSAKRGQI